VFSVINTFFNARLLQRVEHTHTEVKRTRKVLEAPRRVLYDQEGRPFGTVLALEEDDTDWSVQTSRRYTDPPEASA
jgi:hypothetical protein